MIKVVNMWAIGAPVKLISGILFYSEELVKDCVKL